MTEQENHNLSEILEIILMKYSDDFSRKSRIEAKLIGIVTFLSLIFAVSVSIFLSFWTIKELRVTNLSKILALVLFTQLYFMIFSIAMALIGYRTRNTNTIEIENLFEE